MFNNKRGQTEAVILSILVFQAFIIIMLGFLTISDNDVSKTESGNSLFSFGNIVTNISVLGWGNALIFAPIISILVYVLVRLVRGGG